MTPSMALWAKVVLVCELAFIAVTLGIIINKVIIEHNTIYLYIVIRPRSGDCFPLIIKESGPHGKKVFYRDACTVDGSNYFTNVFPIIGK